MSVSRTFGFGLAALGILILPYDLATGLSGAGSLGFVSLGELWGRIGGASLNLVQAIVQRYLFPALWDPILVTILLLPAWPVLGAAGAGVLFAMRKSKSAPSAAQETVTNSTSHPNS